MNLSFKKINRQFFLLVIAWFATLINSNLPYLIWCKIPSLQNVMFKIFGNTPYCLSKAKLLILAILFVLTFIWKNVRPLRQYFIILFAVILAYDIFDWIGSTSFWQNKFSSPSFQVSMLSTLFLKLGTALVMVIVMLVIRRRRSNFFMVRGNLSAVAAPIRIFGINRPTNWRRLGVISSVCISMGTLTFLLISYHPSISIIKLVIPFLPAVLLFSVINAFSEEMIFRGALLAPLCEAIGSKQALLITGVNFGLAHLGGIYGQTSIVMAVMAGFLGWFLGRSVLETEGFLWAWLIHIFQDILIFSFLAIGAIV